MGQLLGLAAWVILVLVADAHGIAGDRFLESGQGGTQRRLDLIGVGFG